MVSVIVPIYNVEKYLERCLDSIVNQTYRNLEIILVNDGSTDRSGEICRRYMQSDSRIRLLDQKNLGLSAARNAGLDHMRGEYVTFVDSDDYISLSFVKVLLDALLEYKVSLAICDYDKPLESTEDVGTVYSGRRFSLQRMSRDGVYSVMLGQKCREMQFSSAWGKIYHKSIFSDLRFDVGKIFEDTAIAYKIYSLVQEVCVIDLKLYHYVQTFNSITRRNGIFNSTHPDFIEAYMGRLLYFQSYENGKFARLAASWVIMGMANRCDSLNLSGREGREQISNMTKEIYRITGRKVITCRYILYMISPRLYRLMRVVFKKVKGKRVWIFGK